MVYFLITVVSISFLAFLYCLFVNMRDMKKSAPKVRKVMKEFKSGTLHSGSKSGPTVSSRKQAVAIALSEARKSGQKVSAKKAVR